jgi:choline dehydrogenase
VAGGKAAAALGRARRLRRGAREAGIPHTDDFNRGDNEGVGYFEVNQRAGIRWNATKAFLRPIERRPNLQVWTGAHIDRIELDADGRASGVRSRRSAAVLRNGDARSGGEVILATGAIGTPQILQLSGIGPAPLLQAHGIAVRRELAGVGENLQDHLQIRAVFGVEGVQTLNGLANSLLGKAKIALHYAWKRSGPMSMAPSQLGAFTRSRPDRPHPNLEYHVQPLSLDAFGEPLHRYDAFTASVCNLNPTSRGTVQIRSAAIDDAPRIAPDYLATDDDRLVAAESLRITRRIVAQPALARFKPRELKPGVQFESDAELAQLAGDIGTTIFHPVGTAKMGPAADPKAVVDARLRVHGVPGLRVVDASIMPTITSGNTNAPTLMIAERAAEWIRAANESPGFGHTEPSDPSLESEAMKVHAVARVRLDADGRVTGVDWGPVNTETNEWHTEPAIADVSEVVAALRRGDDVFALFPGPHGLEPARRFRIVDYDNGWETINLDGPPTHEHEIHDMLHVEG